MLAHTHKRAGCKNEASSTKVPGVNWGERKCLSLLNQLKQPLEKNKPALKWPISTVAQGRCLHSEHRQDQLLKPEVQWANWTTHGKKSHLLSSSRSSHLWPRTPSAHCVPDLIAHQPQLFYLVQAAENQCSSTAGCSPNAEGKEEHCQARGRVKEVVKEVLQEETVKKQQDYSFQQQ